ncbi:MAG: ATP-binding protein [Clostridia bacterium]|nr:ATP-binding protein [Clostridia bacterium]
MRRMIVIAGHYGSGKTELAVSLAMELAQAEGRAYPRLAIVDLDVANPYFRSRERMDVLEAHGVSVYGDTFHSTGATAELPALTAALRAPLEDEGCQTIIDLGGNDAGARVLRQFGKYFEGNEHELWAVVNFRRYETLTVETAREHVESIQNELRMPVTGLVNNTHLLRETTPEILREGCGKAKALSEEMGIPLLFTCYPAGIIQPQELDGISPLRPLGLYMRPAYLDK